MLPAILVATGPARATDGIEPIGFSMQSLMRGGTDVAIGDSALSQIENPATLTLLPRQLDTNWEVLMPRTDWVTVKESDESLVRHVPLGHVGVAIPYDERLSFGLAAYSKGQLESSFKKRHLSYPLLRQQAGADLRNFALPVNAAYRVTDDLSVGAGLRLEMITGWFTSLGGPVTIEFERGLAIGGGFQAGLHYRIRPGLTVGAGYRSPTWFQDLFGSHDEAGLSGRWRVSMPRLRPISLGNAVVENIVLPQKVSAGVAWEPTERLRLSAEARWIGYSESVLDRATYALDRPFRWRVRAPIGYRDQWVLATGAEYKLSEHWTAACGYHYASDAMRSEVMLPIVAMIAQHHITTGLRYERENWWVGTGYIVGLPSTLRANGRTSIPLGSNYAVGHTRQVQHSVFAGFGFRW